MLELYNQILYRPLLNVLVFFYQGIPFHDLGLAIILLTIAIRLLIYPLVAQSMRAQKRMADLQPEIKALQEKYKDNKEEQAKKLLELYSQRGVNPFSGCLPLLIQIPLLIALYNVFRNATGPEVLSQLYAFIPRPEAVSAVAFGLIDLSESSIMLAILAGVSQFIQAYFMPAPAIASKEESAFQRTLRNQTLYVLPIVITAMSFRLPAALPLYWTVLNLFGILQQELVKRRS